MSHVDVKQASIRLEELIEQASRREEVVITKNDRPLARLSSAEGKRKRQFGSIKGEIRMSDDFDEPLEDFNGDSSANRARAEGACNGSSAASAGGRLRVTNGL